MLDSLCYTYRVENYTRIESVNIMNEENANNVNQNVTTPASVEAAPAAPAQPAPVEAAPVAPVQPAPVEAASAAPVAPAPVEAAPVAPAPVEAAPVAPAAPVQPTPAPVEAAPVAPAAPAAPAQPAPVPITVAPAAPAQPVPVQQPAVGVPPVTPEQPPKKKGNVLFIVIVVVLLLAIIGLVVAFVLNNKKEDSKKEEPKITNKDPQEDPKKEDPVDKPSEPVSNSNTYELSGYKFTFPEGYKVQVSSNYLDVLDNKKANEYRLVVDNWYTYEDYSSENAAIEQELVKEYTWKVTDRGEKSIGNKTWYVITGSVDNLYLTYAYTRFNGGTFMMLLMSVQSDYSSSIQTISKIMDEASGSTSFDKGEKPATKVEIPKIDGSSLVIE